MHSKWMLRQTSANINELAQATGLSGSVAHILAVRGYRELSDISSFLDADKLPLASPFLFKDMDKAVSITYEAIKSHKKIAVFGDYDADGILSTVILHKTISSLGADVVFYIPARETEGYGLNKEAILSLKEAGVNLIITCDNGISAFEEIEFANSFGIGTIILDHHEVQKAEKNGLLTDILPAALAVVDAKQSACSYPYKDYCAAALCYRFSEALYAFIGKDWLLLAEDLLPFVAIATICDMVDLLGENRNLVKRGISHVQASQNIGLQLLLRFTGISNRPILPYHIGFILGPCINACGRLEMGAIAVELFLTENHEQAEKLASYLVELNNSRKEITSQGYEKAIEMVEKEKLHNNPIVFLHCPSIQESVAGIIAGKLKDRYHKPAFVVAGGDKDILRGSCRSVEGYNVFQALSCAQDLLNSFGGHPMAAGFAVKKELISELNTRLINEYPPDAEDMVKIFRIDKEISLCDVNISLAKQLEKLQPFGKGNPVPTFADKNVKVSRISFIGKDAQIIKLYCQGKKAKIKNGFLEAVSFYGKEKLENLITEKYGATTWINMLDGQLPELSLDLIFSLSINEYESREYLQLHLLDFRLSN